MSIRLFKVRVQPVFLDEQDREQAANVLDIPAADWRALVADGGPFDQEIARMIAERQAQHQQVRGNPAQRRATARPANRTRTKP